MNASHDVENEIESLRVCQGNENIVSLVEYLKDENYKYIVLEILKGGELFSQIRSCNHFSESKAKTFFKQLVNAVKFMHSKKIIHRDLKPENIMFVKSSQQLKIVDFGFACRKSLTEMLPRYTLDYASPESFVKGTVDETRDIWSLGAILYTMLCGNSPFMPMEYNDTSDEKLRRICQKEKILKGNFNTDGVNWSNLSLDVRNLIGSMLCVRSSDRISIDQIFSHRWLREQRTNIRHESGLHSTSNEISNVCELKKIHFKQTKTDSSDHEQNGDTLHIVKSTKQTADLERNLRRCKMENSNDSTDYFGTIDLSYSNSKSEEIKTVDNRYTKNDHHTPSKFIPKTTKNIKSFNNHSKKSNSRPERKKCQKSEFNEVKIMSSRKRSQIQRKENTDIKKRKLSQDDSLDNFIGFSPSTTDFKVKLFKWSHCLSYEAPINGFMDNVQITNHNDKIGSAKSSIDKELLKKAPDDNKSEKTFEISKKQVHYRDKLITVRILASTNAARPSLIQERRLYLIQNQKK